MKLIEVVVLMGAHCISPVQHSNAVTEAAKVQCAVVVERDTEKGSTRVLPAAAANRPEVVAVLRRLNGGVQADIPPGTRIEPAFALPGGNATATPAAAQPVPSEITAAAPPVQPPDAAPTPPAEEKAPTKPVTKPAVKTAAKTSSQCRGSAQPKWYKTKDGHRKYRCVRAG